MGKPSPEIMKFMELYKIDSDEVWEVRSGGAWAIKHKALERAAAENGVTFDPPTVIEGCGADKIVALCISGTKGARREWSIGEAAPGNNKNAYPYAMAEKRGKDRVVLKLLDISGVLYSDAEADDFDKPNGNGKRQNPHVTRPEDISDPIEYDEHGEVVDNIPRGDPSIDRLPKSKAREDWSACQREIQACPTARELDRWGTSNANRVASFPTDWQEILRGVFRDRKNELRSKEAA